MAASSTLRRLKCPHCAATSLCGHEEMADRLRKIGTLRREAKPTSDVLIELFEASIGRLSCPDCCATGLQLEMVQDDFDEWPESRTCEICNQSIPPERLEIFPDATRCAACQGKEVVGQEEADYCPKCGAILQLRQTNRGVSCYKMWCPDCRR